MWLAFANNKKYQTIKNFKTMNPKLLNYKL